MTFSFSAPRFTEADERYEQEHLTDDERLEAWRDVYGKTEPLHESPEVRETAEACLRREIVANIHDKDAYLDAIDKCPDLVRTESPAIRFLRCEKYNVSRAAERLVKYWDLRKVVFGDKAFLPMTIKGGVLSEKDGENLKLGHISLLPPDQYGRTVMYERRGHLDDAGIDYASLLRVQLYMFHVALEEETAQTHGIVFLANNRGILPNHFSRKHEKLLWTAVTTCLPVQVKAIHCCYPKSFMDLFLPVLKQIFGRHLRLRHVVHDDGSEGEVLYSLRQYGFEDSGLPHAFSGTFRVDPQAFVQDRLELEGPRLMRRLSTNTVSTSSSRSSLHSSSDSSSTSSSFLCVDSSSSLDSQLENLIVPDGAEVPRRVSHWALLSSLT